MGSFYLDDRVLGEGGAGKADAAVAEVAPLPPGLLCSPTAAAGC